MHQLKGILKNMKALEKANKLYGKYLFIVIPAITTSVMIWELFANVSNDIGMAANFFIGAVSIMFAYFYIKGGKKSITFFMIQIVELYYAIFLFLSRRIVINNICGMLFVSIGIFMLFFVLGFNGKYRDGKDN